MPPLVQRPAVVRSLPAILFLFLACGHVCAQQEPAVQFKPSASAFTLADPAHTAPILLDNDASPTLRTVTSTFAADIERVTGRKAPAAAPKPQEIIVVGVLGHSGLLDTLVRTHKLDPAPIANHWESALTTVISDPFPGVHRALVIAAADRRGAAYALFTLSRQMGVSPWYWWADVPVQHHEAVYVSATNLIQPTPSVQYRGIFLNDEDWGLRPWAAKVMDPQLHNIGPNTYTRIFELLLRLHANTLWPAMHPGSLAFNAVPENAKLADEWGIIMGSSHSEALLRNNVGEWDEKRDGPWNYQKNAPAMQRYWDQRLSINGRYENFFTVGLRGVHDSGLEATGTPQVKAALVEDVIRDQRKLLTSRVSHDLPKVPQVIWLYKESLDLYRVGMKIPDDVTLGWTDDNYGYIRQLPNAEEQKRRGGSGVYYHVSYWGSPHDYLWLCTTPPSLIREEMTKAYDHGARKYWILNVGDLKPAEADIDYFMQLATNEPEMAKVDQLTFLKQWSAEQFPISDSAKIAELLNRYYNLNFIRKPEFMGFNGYNDAINRTAFNPLAWGNQNHHQSAAWASLGQDMLTVRKSLLAQLSEAYSDAYIELVDYPIITAEAQSEKLLSADRTFVDASHHDFESLRRNSEAAQIDFQQIQRSTKWYNTLNHDKWSGMMSASPRDRHVFEMPALATEADANKPLPSSWRAGDESSVISLNAARFTRHTGDWRILPDLGISRASVVLGQPGAEASNLSASLEYDITTKITGEATLALHFLPTFPVDSDHRLRFAVAVDQNPPTELDLAPESANPKTWAINVLRNDAVLTVPLGTLPAGPHTLHILYRDPGVVLQHLVVSYPDTPPAYPVPPETRP